MPRSKSIMNVVRDADIIARARKNVPRRDISREFGVSEARISQIISANLDPRYPDEGLRSWLLEGYYGDLEVLQEIKESPGRPITSGAGAHVRDAHGNPAYDEAVRVDATRTAAQVRLNIAKLTGTEKPVPPKPTGDSPEIIELYRHFDGVIQENLALKEQLTELQSRLAAIENSVPADIVD